MSKDKFDSGKIRMAQIPPEAMEAIGAVMTHGIEKYSEGSWKQVEAYRYRDAMLRHIVEYLKEPNGNDVDSGLPHLWHIITNAAFLCHLEILA